MSKNNLQATVLVFCNSLLSYFISSILHGRHNIELRGLPYGWKQTGFKSNYITHLGGKYTETGKLLSTQAGNNSALNKK